MNRDLKNELPLKSYLLGDLGADERQRLEQQLMIDSGAFEELHWTEDEMIDEYLSGALSDREKERFENFFLSTPERHQKLSFAKALKRYVTEHRPKKVGRPLLHDLWQAFWHPQNQGLKWAFAASLLMVIAVGSWSTVQIRRLRAELDQAGTGGSRDQLAQMQGRTSELEAALRREQDRNSLLERQATELKRSGKGSLLSLSPGQLQSTLLSVVLTPGRFRDSGSVRKVQIPAGTDLVQIDLKLESRDYEQYQAALQRVGENAVLAQTSSITESSAQGALLRVIVPVTSLSRGDYVLKLSGQAAAGDFEDIGSCFFRVMPR